MTNVHTNNTTPAEMAGGMPSTLKLVEEAVDTFAVDKSKSSALGIDRPALVDLGMILVDPERKTADGLAWLSTELGEGLISQSAYYRFASDFRGRFDQVRRRYRQRLAKLSIDHATAGRRDGMAEVLMTQITSLMAEKVVDTDDLAQLEGRELAGILTLLDGWTKAKFKGQELALRAADDQRKAAKLEADLAKAQAELDLKHQQLSRLPEQIKALQSRIDDLAKRSSRGQTIDPQIFEQIRHELAGLAAPAPGTPGTPGTPGSIPAERGAA